MTLLTLSKRRLIQDSCYHYHQQMGLMLLLMETIGVVLGAILALGNRVTVLAGWASERAALRWQGRAGSHLRNEWLCFSSALHASGHPPAPRSSEVAAAALNSLRPQGSAVSRVQHRGLRVCESTTPHPFQSPSRLQAHLSALTSQPYQ